MQKTSHPPFPSLVLPYISLYLLPSFTLSFNNNTKKKERLSRHPSFPLEDKQNDGPGLILLSARLTFIHFISLPLLLLTPCTAFFLHDTHNNNPLSINVTMDGIELSP